MKKAILIACVIALSGCGSVDIYDDPTLKHEVGVEFYLPKPYLMVVRGKEKTDASVIYMPDQHRPRYAKFTAGWGSSELSLSLSNGMLASIGQKTDSKIPETLTAIGSLATAAATAGATMGLFAAPKIDIATVDSTLLTQHANTLGTLLDQAEKEGVLLKQELDAGRTAVKQLKEAAVTVKTDRKAAVDKIQKALDELDKIRTTGVGEGPDAKLIADITQLKAIIKAFQATLLPTAKVESVELYEIDNKYGYTTLRKVALPIDK